MFGCLGGSFRGYGGFFGRRPWELGGPFWCLGCSFCGYRGGGVWSSLFGAFGLFFPGVLGVFLVIAPGNVFWCMGLGPVWSCIGGFFALIIVGYCIVLSTATSCTRGF